MNNQISLYEFGHNFLGPVCSEYFYALKQRCEDVKPDRLVFLAREGYLFSQVYQQLVDKGLFPPLPNTYLYASRTFLFRICIGDPRTWDYSLSHGFYGSLQKLLVGRFGFTLSQVKHIFTESELRVKWYLPFEQKPLEIFLLTVLDKLKGTVVGSRVAYIDYLRDCGVSSAHTPLMLDVGYAGTIQKLLTGLLKTDTQGLYFIATQEGQYPVGNKVANMKSVYKQGVKMGDGYTMLDRSLFLESLLTAPQGQFVDISKKSELSIQPFNFFFGRLANSQKNMHELQTVFEGAIEAICHAFENDIRYSVSEIEEMYEKFAYNKHMFPRATWSLFDVDDAISGNSNVNPLHLFRL